MDNIPENAVLGITLAAGCTVNVAFLIAIFVSDLPEGVASTNDTKSSGLSRKYILVLWSIAIVIGTISTTIDYGILSNTSPCYNFNIYSIRGWCHLGDVRESMIPEAFKKEGIGKGMALLNKHNGLCGLTSFMQRDCS